MAGKKGFGRKSSAQDNFLAPLAPISVTATDVGTSRGFDNGAATVSFSLPGTSPAATSYTVTSSPGSFTTTGSSSPLTVQGLQSNTSYTFTVTASNAQGTSASSSPSDSVTITTVPATPSAPTATTVSNQAKDSVSWSAPSNGGIAITNYNWESNDSKSGNTASTSVTVNQEQGTSQQYRVRAQNANGYSNFSAYSSSVTTFSFTPFSFAPFSVFGFSPFGVFGFSPFGVFGFSPFSVFGFSPFSFYQGGWSLEGATLVLTPEGFVEAQTLQPGDKLLSIDFDQIDINSFDPPTWSTFDPLTVNNYVETTILQIKEREVENIVYINGEGFSDNHYILTRKNYESRFIVSSEIDETYEIWSYATRDWAPVYNIEISPAPEGAKVYSINAEPYDIIITNGSIGYDADPS